jgi:preprotein translocase subunit SecY
MPYVSATCLLLLLSALIPALRRWRDAPGAGHDPFQRLVLLLTCVLALCQGVGLAIYSHYLRETMSIPAPGSVIAYRAEIAVYFEVGALVSYWIAHSISRWGLGNGVGILFLWSWGTGVPERLRATFRPTLPDTPSPILAVLVFLAALLLAVILVTTRRTVRLGKTASTGAPGGGIQEPPAVTIRLQPSGSAAFAWADRILMANLTLLWITSLGGKLHHSLYSRIATSLIPVLAAVLSLVAASWIFNSRDLIRRPSRLGLFPMDARGHVFGPTDLQRLQERMARVGAALIFLYAALWAAVVLSGTFLTGLAGLADASLIVSVAVILQIASNIKTWRRVPRGISWALVHRFDVGLDARLALATLRARGLTPMLHDSGPGVVTGSPAPWEACRPYYPSLVVYGRLAGGGAEVWVPTDEAADARRLLGNSFSRDVP